MRIFCPRETLTATLGKALQDIWKIFQEKNGPDSEILDGSRRRVPERFVRSLEKMSMEI